MDLSFGRGTEKRWVIPMYKGEALADSRNGACSWHELGTEHRGELGKIEGRIVGLYHLGPHSSVWTFRLSLEEKGERNERAPGWRGDPTITLPVKSCRVEARVGAIFAFRCQVECKFTDISIMKTQGWKVGSDFIRGPMVAVFGWDKKRLSLEESGRSGERHCMAW